MLIDRASLCVFCGSVRLLRFTARAFDTTDQRPINIVERHDCQAAWQRPIAHSEEQSVKIFEAEYAKTPGHFDGTETAARCEVQGALSYRAEIDRALTTDPFINFRPKAESI